MITFGTTAFGFEHFGCFHRGFRFFVAGAATGPADLEDSVSTAGLAAMKAAGFVRARSRQASSSSADPPRLP